MIAVGMGANVIVADRNAEALRRVAARFGNAVRTIFSTPTAIAELVKRAGLLTGAVLLPGAATPKVVSRGMLPNMKPGAVIVDVAIDQGGCCETSRPTTHPDPTYLVDGIVHYCVSNMSGEVPPTSTFALDNAIPPFVLAIAQKGWRNALRDDIHLRAGLNVSGGKITYAPVAWAHGLDFTPIEDAPGLRGFLELRRCATRNPVDFGSLTWPRVAGLHSIDRRRRSMRLQSPAFLPTAQRFRGASPATATTSRPPCNGTTRAEEADAALHLFGGRERISTNCSG